MDIRTASKYMGHTEDQLVQLFSKWGAPTSILRFSRAGLDTFMEERTQIGDIKLSTLTTKQQIALKKKSQAAFTKEMKRSAAVPASERSARKKATR